MTTGSRGCYTERWQLSEAKTVHGATSILFPTTYVYVFDSIMHIGNDTIHSCTNAAAGCKYDERVGAGGLVQKLLLFPRDTQRCLCVGRACARESSRGGFHPSGPQPEKEKRSKNLSTKMYGRKRQLFIRR